MTAHVKGCQPILFRSACFVSSGHRQRRSQHAAPGAPAAIGGWGAPCRASVGGRPLCAARVAWPSLGPLPRGPPPRGGVAAAARGDPCGGGGQRAGAPGAARACVSEAAEGGGGGGPLAEPRLAVPRTGAEGPAGGDRHPGSVRHRGHGDRGVGTVPPEAQGASLRHGCPPHGWGGSRRRWRGEAHPRSCGGQPPDVLEVIMSRRRNDSKKKPQDNRKDRA
jgi:hypothetical protein